MAVVLWVIVALIQNSYRIHDEIRGAMALHTAVEQYRHGEDLAVTDALNNGKQYGGHPFSHSGYIFHLYKDGNPFTGWKIRGTASGGTWMLEIQEGVFDPENFLRMLTLADQEE